VLPSWSARASVSWLSSKAREKLEDKQGACLAASPSVEYAATLHGDKELCTLLMLFFASRRKSPNRLNFDNRLIGRPMGQFWMFRGKMKPFIIGSYVVPSI
jgi:hypothetical protein